MWSVFATVWKIYLQRNCYLFVAMRNVRRNLIGGENFFSVCLLVSLLRFLFALRVLLYNLGLDFPLSLYVSVRVSFPPKLGLSGFLRKFQCWKGMLWWRGRRLVWYILFITTELMPLELTTLLPHSGCSFVSGLVNWGEQFGLTNMGVSLKLCLSWC